MRGIDSSVASEEKPQFDISQPMAENMYSPTGGTGFNLQNIMQKNRRGVR
jgi:hypothetical protein